MSNTEIKESVDHFDKYLRQRLYDTNFNMEEVSSYDFYFDGIYEDEPLYW